VKVRSPIIGVTLLGDCGDLDKDSPEFPEGGEKEKEKKGVDIHLLFLHF
jgi:hypothetical protein